MILKIELSNGVNTYIYESTTTRGLNFRLDEKPFIIIEEITDYSNNRILAVLQNEYSITEITYD